MNFIQHVHEDKKEWARQLTGKDIANILNSFALLKPNLGDTDIESNKLVLHNSEIAAIAGLQGERAFEELVRQNLSSDFKINNMAKTSKSGDFIITWTSYKANKEYTMLIDVKNYKTTVPSKEVVKFHRDVEIRDVDCGMLLSLSSKIVGFTHMIESKYITIGNKKVPLVFMHSNMPSAITEMIKTTFHIIETSELHTNKIQYMDEFISSVSDLHENINIVSQCRDAMSVSKHEIEKSLNGVMMQLMTCEYELVSNIKKIQTTMANYNTIEEKLSTGDLIFDEFAELGLTEVEKLIKYIVVTFDISKDTEILLARIIAIIYANDLCPEYDINLSKKILHLNKLKVLIAFKFMKTTNHIIIESATKNMVPIICNMAKKKKCKTTSVGYVVKINDNTIDDIIKLVSVL